MTKNPIQLKEIIILLALPFIALNTSYSQDIGNFKEVNPDDATDNIRFGQGVDMDGDYMIVGAPYHAGGDTYQGAAYIFKEDQGGADNWGQIKQLLPSDAFNNCFAGWEVAISGDYAIVGSYSSGAGGIANIFYKDQGGTDNWGEIKALAPGGKGGFDVDIDGDIAVVGDYYNNSNQGIVYIYYKDQGGTNNWGLVKSITASDAAGGDYYGHHISLDGDQLIVGAPCKNSNAGAAYVYYRNQGGTDNWGEVKKILSSDIAAGDDFGAGLVIYGNYAVVGSYLKDDPVTNAGRAYVFGKDVGGADNWGQITMLQPDDVEDSDLFGYSGIRMYNEYLLIGAYYEDGSGTERGAVYMFKKNEGGADNWGQVAKMESFSPEDEARFGECVAINDEYIVIGAPLDDAGGTDRGAIFMYTIDFVAAGSQDLPYTAVARSASGNVVTNSYISVKISVRNSAGNTVYRETHTPYAGNWGIYSVSVGAGSNVYGQWDDIELTNDTYTINVELDVSSPYDSYYVAESRDFLGFIKEINHSMSAGGELSTTSSSSLASSGMLRAFATLEDRDGWTYTGVSECKGTPNTWTAMSSVGAPSVRIYSSIACTGSLMLIWAGAYSGTYYNDLFKYDIENDTWEQSSSTGAPSVRMYATAEWTGEELIVFGGDNNSTAQSGGGAYNPKTDTWRTLSSTNAPSARYYHSSVWTGEKMIIWGGTTGGTNYVNTGSIYDPATDSWSTMSTTNAPDARILNSAVWTGEEMIIWGGQKYTGSTVQLNDGYKYNPATDTWTAISTTSPPSIRTDHSAVWAGEKMIIWGGRTNSTTSLQNGGVYDPDTDTWSTMTTSNSPLGTTWSQYAWTGAEMIIWGGQYYSGSWLYANTGAAYDPDNDSWRTISTTGAPIARSVDYQGRTIWTGQELIIWGGWSGDYSPVYDDGARLGTAQSIYWYRKD